MLYVRSDVPTDTLIYCFLRVLFVSAKVDGSENWLNELFPDPRPPIAPFYMQIQNHAEWTLCQ